MAIIKRCTIKRLNHYDLAVTEVKDDCELHYISKIKVQVGCKIPKTKKPFRATVFFDRLGFVFDWKPETYIDKLKDGKVYMTESGSLYRWDFEKKMFFTLKNSKTKLFQNEIATGKNFKLPVAEVL